eukprot:jgi/Ulvmu1/5633/UM023_0173.1
MDRPGIVNFYESIDCDIKSKIPELTSAMRSGIGLPRDIATWLLIYHVEVEQKSQDVINGGAPQIALALLLDESCTVDWPACSALLARLTANHSCTDPVARLRASGRAAPLILLSTLLNVDASSNSRTQTADCLIDMLSHPDCAPYTVGTLQPSIVWGDFRDELVMGRDIVVKGCITRVAMHLLSKSDALVASVKSSGIIAALLQFASQARRDKQLEACFGCLAAICADQSNWPELLKGNVVRVATDVLGPPPPGFVMWEFVNFRLWELGGTPRSTIQAEHSSLLSVCTLAVPSTFNFSVRTQNHAVTCLNHLLQVPRLGLLQQLSDLRAAYRLGRAILKLLASGSDSESALSGKAKKKGPVLDPDQIDALAAMTGALKILTVNAACAFRVARTGCLPLLLQLKDHTSLPLRRNCQMILSNTVYLRENELFVSQLDTPEHRPRQMLKLSDDEAADVSIDFAEGNSKAAETEIKVHGHLFNLCRSEALALAGQAIPEQ